MNLPIKKIILENMNNQDKFGIVTGAYSPGDLPIHNLNSKTLVHDLILNRNKMGFAQQSGHMQGNQNIHDPKHLLQYQNDLNLINHLTKK